MNANADNVDPYGSFQGGPLENGYGSIDGPQSLSGAKQYKIKAPFMLAQRRRMNLEAILISLFVPWLIGVFACWSMTFKVRYEYPWLAYGVLACCIIAVLVFGYFAFQAFYEKTHKGLHVPSWYIFCFLTSLFLVAAGCLIGNALYDSLTLPAYQNGELTTYSSVDASKMRGSQLLDAGTIYFGPGTSLDLTKTMSFKNKETYCVAPLVSGSDTPQTYDFWVVGKGCCSSPPASGYPHGYTYHCGNWNRLAGTYVNRLMEDNDRAYYRMAVQQAEGAYTITATHPLFFTWPSSSSSSSSSSYSSQSNSTSGGGSGGGGMLEVNVNKATTLFEGAVFGSFLLQLFLVIAACIAFSTLGAPS